MTAKQILAQFVKEEIHYEAAQAAVRRLRQRATPGARGARIATPSRIVRILEEIKTSWED